MMNDVNSIILIEQYLNKELDSNAKQLVETRLANDAAFLALFESHVTFLEELQEYSEREKFKASLQEAGTIFINQSDEFSRDQTFQNASKNEHRSIIRKLIFDQNNQGKSLDWKILIKFNFISTAVVAIIAVFSTLWLTGYYKNLEKNSSYYKELRRDVNAVKKNVNAHHAVLKNINDSNTGSTNNFGATGFMISVNGYVVTNNHVISGADSIHLQNSKGESFQAKIIYTDDSRDLAILMIQDSTFRNPKNLPYTIKENISELGEDVFTLGYPRDEAVYGQGYLSSMSGYDGDTTAYQISIPLNPGNSGGPLLDSKGNVIGIISGKQSGLDGASFAIKAKSILDFIEEVPAEAWDRKLNIQKKNHLNGLKRTEQLDKIKDFVYLVKVF